MSDDLDPKTAADGPEALAQGADGGGGGGGRDGGDGGGADGLPKGIGHVQPVSIKAEMESAYVDYAMSVIVGRALPDVRDGLKPVHRRVLFAMHEGKNNWNGPYRKSARIVGDVIGKYHPHGDQSVYDTLVRMAQPFSLRYLLVDGQGNFGSVDGDPPAAMRYTEVRMDKLAHELLADLDKETVDFVPNYDGQDREPSVLPTKVPNLLVNGSGGIAVGMATNVPPHNLREVCNALIALVEDPFLELRGLMAHIAGPDFPTGGTICGRQGIVDAYETGRGKIKLRAKTRIEVEKKGGRETILVDEIPYQVNKSKLVEHIAELVNEKKIEGISDVRDESDREGMRIVIELKRDVVGQVVLNQLLQQTQLQITFGIINLAIVAGQPRVLSLKEMLELFLDHRREVVTRRCLYELRKAEERAHILQGYLIALDHLDEVIAIIRGSADPPTAKAGLIARFALSEIQAQSILDMRLQRLTGLERERIAAEFAEVQKTIAWLKSVLDDDGKLMGVIKDEIAAVRDEFSDARRTDIVQDEGQLSVEDLIADEDMVVTISRAGYIKRTPLSTYRQQRRGGRGKTGMTTKEEDFVVDLFVASAHQELLFFTSLGKAYALKVYELPQGAASTRGKPIVNLLPVEKAEEIRAVLPVQVFVADAHVLMATKFGTVKKTELLQYNRIRSSGIIAIVLDEGDDLIDAKIVHDTDNVVLATREGMSIHFRSTDARAMGRATRGVRGIDLTGSDAVVSLAVIPAPGGEPDDSDAPEPEDAVEPEEGAAQLFAGTSLLTICENGYGKATPPKDYRLQTRGGKGVIAIKTTARNGKVVGLRAVDPAGEVLIVTDGGTLLRIPVNSIRVIGRNTQGVKLINVSDGEKVVSFEHFVDTAE
ncbi:MAG: DNA gyrase subunit A [Deltaproteobacteria bacterium]|nr:DNA gyrase subunit A [Deltaproteobacteria bacterium]